MEKLKMNLNDWDIVERMPSGWEIDKNPPRTYSPPKGYVFISNGKNILKGGKKALLIISKNDNSKNSPKMAKTTTKAATAKPKHKLTAADRKKGQEKRAMITDLARKLALQDNPNAKTVTKTIKVRDVVATKGKLKKSMAAYRKEAECTIEGTCTQKPKPKPAAKPKPAKKSK